MSGAWLLNGSSKSYRYTCALVVLLILVLLLSYTFKTDRSSGSLLYLSTTRDLSLGDIANLTLGFEGILAINLPERTDHHDGLVLASHVSDISMEFILGVHGDSVVNKVLPAHADGDMSSSQRGSWRAHINAISKVIENGWSTGLIIEDDVDWDIRLKQQLHDFAIGSQHILSAPVNSGSIRLQDAIRTSKSTHSPYGDGWDVLWLGHCGMALPAHESTTVIHENDSTVAPIKDQKSYDVNAPSPLRELPEHSRVITKVSGGTCSLAYAVSREGAKRLLFALGLRRMNKPFDLMLRQWCEGDTEIQGFQGKCISVLPQLFDHHRRIGPNEIDSDISRPNGIYRDYSYTLNIRQSVRMNMEKLLTGSNDFDDQWPD